MKHILSNSLHALLLTVALTAGGIVQAQTIEATRTTVTSDGIVSEFGPQGLLIKTAVDSQPIRYISTDTTNYVDELGNPVSASLVTAGVPTTVYYTKVGDRLIVSKVMVKTGATARVVTPSVTETTTYSEGTVADFGADRIVVRSQSSPQPLPYTYTKTTSYVDEAGAPIAVDTVRSGVPVTVYYVKGADGALIASKVVVRRAAAAVAVPPVVETQRTTTTTTVPVPRDKDDDDN
ncbi:hypothetical protein [Brevifollis gellanilyticus]|uniref:G5 domain-containing protein n=1 Tax=Brevifollis gellanilyticus TaxID=748831 RepID=A0A512M9N6_9BACT|nr:hypothetical protein [Brevifollis gellanilyticus]GEP43442.1 hypothetical protein BGE01nite_27330 [Brevifollis gellanilyticus]